ncbi:hypothetical protein F5144DRAFT_93125 [Chaetomium tenue]|uniref:Uncharacterized protein n=1 Tax=Chaetomium tenue TaxID=1854479 RepID=A0ACB7PF64_9PEZI|nr:hypothetical protein F5144DRAFT_93125 [Chaetomium globosum]
MAFGNDCSHCSVTISAVSAKRSVASPSRLVPCLPSDRHQFLFIIASIPVLCITTFLRPAPSCSRTAPAICNLSLTDCPSSPFPHKQTANRPQIGPFSLYPGAGDPRHPHFLEGKPLIYARCATSDWHRQSLRSHTHCCCFRLWPAEETPAYPL